MARINSFKPFRCCSAVSKRFSPCLRKGLCGGKDPTLGRAPCPWHGFAMAVWSAGSVPGCCVASLLSRDRHNGTHAHPANSTRLSRWGWFV